MSLTTGHEALINRVVTMTTAASIVTPNAPDRPSVPRYVVQAAGGSQSTYTLDGDTNANPEIVVRCEVAKNSDEAEVNQLVGELVARFPVNLIFDGLKIQQAPLVRPPIPGDGVYAIPVVIRGFMTF